MLIFPIIAFILIRFIPPIVYSIYYSPNIAIHFLSLPKDKNKHIILNYIRVNFNNSFNFEKSSLLNQKKQYSVLIETDQYYILFFPQHHKFTGSFINPKFFVINKSENKNALAKTSQPFIDLILPNCDKYIKIS